MATEITPSKTALEQWQYEGSRIAAKIKRAFVNGEVKTWDDISRMEGVIPSVLPVAFPFLINVLDNFLRTYSATFVQFKTKQFVETLASADKNEIQKVPGKKYGNYTLEPDQQGVVNAIFNDLFLTNKSTTALNDGKAGVGKTPTAGGLIFEVIRHYLTNPKLDPLFQFRVHKVIVITPKNVIAQYKNELRQMGLEKFVNTNEILVTNGQHFISASGKAYIREEPDQIDDRITHLRWTSNMMAPVLLIIDESHKFNNPDAKRTKAIVALIEANENLRVVFFSATPWQRANDSYLFARCLGKVGEFTITDRKEFNSFVMSIDNKPNSYNNAANERMRKLFAPHIYSFPYIKWKHKAINTITLVDFENSADRDIANKAFSRFIENCKKAGRNTSFGQHEKNVELLILRRTVEPLRVPYISRRLLASYEAQDNSYIVGTAFKPTITKLAFMLTEAGVPRDKISIIWGGNKRLDPKYIMSDDEFQRESTRPDLLQRLCDDKEFAKKIKFSLLYREDRIFNNETPEQQAYRHKKLVDLRLVHHQSEEDRQSEIDRFQNGETQFCLMTIAAGGVGLSLDKRYPHVLDRIGLFTPIYSGIEAAQVVCRGVRRKSIADIYQEFLMMRGTPEHYHVAPAMLNKLKNLATLTNRATDFAGLLLEDMPDDNIKQAITLRSKVEAALIADQDTSAAEELDEDDDDE